MRDNFLLWQAYILPYLRIQRLLGFITSTIPVSIADLAGF
jgi:hypothetical protein